MGLTLCLYHAMCFLTIALSSSLHRSIGALIPKLPSIAILMRKERSPSSPPGLRNGSCWRLVWWPLYQPVVALLGRVGELAAEVDSQFHQGVCLVTYPVSMRTRKDACIKATAPAGTHLQYHAWIPFEQFVLQQVETLVVRHKRVLSR